MCFRGFGTYASYAGKDPGERGTGDSSAAFRSSDLGFQLVPAHGRTPGSGLRSAPGSAGSGRGPWAPVIRRPEHYPLVCGARPSGRWVNKSAARFLGPAGLLLPSSALPIVLRARPSSSHSTWNNGYFLLLSLQSRPWHCVAVAPPTECHKVTHHRTATNLHINEASIQWTGSQGWQTGGQAGVSCFLGRSKRLPEMKAFRCPSRPGGLRARGPPP